MKATRCASVGLVFALLSGQVLADEPAPLRLAFNIHQQPLEDALNEFAQQTGLQLMFQSRMAHHRDAPAVTGTLEPEVALKELLAHSGLRYDFVNARTVAIRVAAAPPAEGATNAQAGGPVLAAADVSSRARVAPELDAAGGPDSLEQVVITGSHIRGTTSAGTKVLVIDREEIERSGHSRIQDLLETLPQNFAGISEDSTQQFASNYNAGAEIQLRGLGAGTTLTLVNGQRQPGGGTFGAFTDVASIPASAIERIEVLTDGASAIYGSDAIGGVVNIILRDFVGAETRLRLGTASGDANEKQFAQLLGTAWSSGSVLLGYQYLDRDSLLYGEREYTATGGDMREFGGTDWRRASASLRGASPGNILCPATGVSTCTPNQPAYAIPAGQNGVGLTVDSLLPGQINYADRSATALLPEQETHSAFLSAEQRLGERVELIAGLRFNTRDTLAFGTGPTRTLSVPSTNAFYFNPFGGMAPVRVEYDFTESLGPVTSAGQTETLAGTFGAIIDLSPSWRLSLSSSFGRERTDFVRRNQFDFTVLPAALADSNPATALNVFGDGASNTEAALARIRQADEFEHGTSKAWGVAAIFDGPLFEMPSGAARLAFGADFRDDRLDVVSNFQIQGDTRNSRHVMAAFAELSLPLVDEAHAKPGVRHLSLSLAGRFDDYNDFGSTFNPKLGVQWRPFGSMNVRGTWGTSFRAPPFYLSNTDLQNSLLSVTTVNDPASPTGRTTILRRSGVIPDLSEETATSWTAGVDFNIADQVSLSLSYFDIEYDDRIQTPGAPATILANASQFAEVIHRNPTRAELDAICAGQTVSGDCTAAIGAIVDTRLRNIAVTNVDGVDLDLSYAHDLPLGRLGLSISGTYTFNYEQAVTEASPLLQFVDTYQHPLALRMRGRLSWSFGGWNLNAAANYAGGYDHREAIPARTIDSWTSLDLGVGYQFNETAGWLSGTRFQLSGINVLDEPPPFVDDFSGFDPANGNIIARTVSFQILKNW